MDRRDMLKTMVFAHLCAVASVMRSTVRQEAPVHAAQDIVLLEAAMAGFRYHEGPKVWGHMRSGDLLVLRREPDNAHDTVAVALHWGGYKIGYLPRTDNLVIANMLDQGAPIFARISRKRRSARPWERLGARVVLAYGIQARLCKFIA